MIKLIDYPNYGYEDGKVYNIKTHRVLKIIINGGSKAISIRNSKTGKCSKHSVAKIAYCAINKLPLDKIPKNTSFAFNEDGTVRITEYSERLAKRAETLADAKRVSIKKIDENIRWLKIQKALLLGELLEQSLLELLTDLANDVEPYILKVTASKIRPELAKDFLLEAVDTMYKRMVNDKILIINPRWYLIRTTRNLIGNRNKLIQYDSKNNKSKKEI